MPSVLEKVYAELERAKARVAILDEFGEDLRSLNIGIDSPDELENALVNGGLVETIKDMVETVEKLSGELEAYRQMFPCSVCGKPMYWDPAGKSEFVSALREAVKPWSHSNCVKKGA